MTGEPAGSGRRVLVLAHAGDEGAVGVAAALEERRGTGSVDLVSDVALGEANWVHHQRDVAEDGADGGDRVEPATTSRVDLADGRTLTHDGFTVVFNRLQGVFPRRFAAADEADRLYAQAETNALVLSWLASFACPVVPGPAPPGLTPAFPSLPALLVAAGRAGLPTRGFTFASDARDVPGGGPLVAPGRYPPTADGRTAGAVSRYLLGRDPALALKPVAGTSREVLVVGEEVRGPVPDGLGPACVRLARESDAPLLGLTFDRRADADGGPDWCLCGGTTFPPLADWDDAVAVARYLDDRAREPPSARRRRLPRAPGRTRGTAGGGTHTDGGLGRVWGNGPPAGSPHERRARNRALMGRRDSAGHRGTGP